MRFTITSLASIIRREMSVFRCSTGWCLMMLRQFGQIVGLPPPARSFPSPLRAAAAPLPASPPALQYSAHMHTSRLLSRVEHVNADQRMLIPKAGLRHDGRRYGAGGFEREEILRVALLDAGGTFGTCGRVVKLMVVGEPVASHIERRPKRNDGGGDGTSAAAAIATLGRGGSQLADQGRVRRRAGTTGRSTTITTKTYYDRLTVLVLAPEPAPSPPGLPSSSPCSHTSLRAAGLTSIRSHQAGQRVAMYETGWNGSSSYG
uniref:Uncharacterized protein n=1 Tax=Anopheles coluzzii TaxID=1518534 RepID=A0A8W7Q105_ANOCL